MRSHPSTRGGIEPTTTKLVPSVGPMAGGRSTTSPVSSRLAGQWPTSKSYEKRFLFAKEQQQPYDFYKVADRLTPAVCCTITRCTEDKPAVCCPITRCTEDHAKCLKALPSLHWGTLVVMLKPRTSSLRGKSTLSK